MDAWGGDCGRVKREKPDETRLLSLLVCSRCLLGNRLLFYAKVDNCESGPSTIPDHSPIFMSVHLNNKRKSTLWRLNSNILNNQVIKDNLKSEIKMYLDNNDTEEVTPPTLWDALKAMIRGKIIAISSYEKKIR